MSMSRPLRLAAALLLACGPAGPPAPARPVPSANPLAGLETAPAGALRFAGRVETSLAAGPYTYLGVRDGDGALRWVATMGAGQPVGAEVEVRGVGLRKGFRSPRLGRVFDTIVFGPAVPLHPHTRQG